MYRDVSASPLTGGLTLTHPHSPHRPPPGGSPVSQSPGGAGEEPPPFPAEASGIWAPVTWLMGSSPTGLIARVTPVPLARKLHLQKGEGLARSYRVLQSPGTRSRHVSFYLRLCFQQPASAHSTDVQTEARTTQGVARGHTAGDWPGQAPPSQDPPPSLYLMIRTVVVRVGRGLRQEP